jgi:hypothetical protein
MPLHRRPQRRLVRLSRSSQMLLPRRMIASGAACQAGPPSGGRSHNAFRSSIQPFEDARYFLSHDGGTRWAVGTAASASAVLSYFVLTHVIAVTNITVRRQPSPLARQAREPKLLPRFRERCPGPGVAGAPSRLLAQGSMCRLCVTRCLNGATHWFRGRTSRSVLS